MIYREEHPNPQWERKEWRNLNGEWEFEFDFGKSAREREAFKNGSLSKRINVPFCPESELSGIANKDFMPSVCYRKIINLSAEEIQKIIFLHFGAVDFISYVYINQQPAAKHIGGFSSFKIDITELVKEGENEIFVIVEDDVRSGEQPAGKQSSKLESCGCLYTRTTGIWQTVWLEFMPKAYIKKARYYTDVKKGILTIMGEVCGEGTLDISAYYQGEKMGESSVQASGNFFVQLNLAQIHLWEIGCGRLYDLEFKFEDDIVKSYFGLRDVKIEGRKFFLNSKCVFGRFVLDQGFYPDGIMTAKTDDILKRDIELSLNAGFNGARLHQKVFEKRFLYHCDKAGYMV